MGKLRGIAAAAALMIGMAFGGEPPAVPADFKIRIGEYGLKPEPVATAEVIVRQGRAYVFPSDTKEVILIEPARERVELIDVGRRVSAEVRYEAIDRGVDRIKRTLIEAADAREKQGGRGKVLEARMTRDLFLTKLDVAESERPSGRQIRLSNPSVEVDADGEPEADAARLAMTAATLAAIAKLGAFRTPNDLPPFVELDAIAALTGERKLRPVELSYLYRLAGPPRKFRRTYQVVPKLTDREVEAIARIDRLRESIPSLRYERYRIVEPAPKGR